MGVTRTEEEELHGGDMCRASFPSLEGFKPRLDDLLPGYGGELEGCVGCLSAPSVWVTVGSTQWDQPSDCQL